MREIPLTRGLVAIVDDADFDLVSRYKWYASPTNKGRSFYACRVATAGGRKKTVRMHRVISGITDEACVDHINRNTLDNRRVNLRAATVTQNNHNRGVRGDVPFKGVRRNGKKFRAQIMANGKLFRLGTFVSAESAALAYDEQAKNFFGEFAYLNFPETASV